MSKFDQLFGSVANRMKQVDRGSWNKFSNKSWNFDLEGDGDYLEVLKGNIMSELPKAGSIETILKEVNKDKNFFESDQATCCCEDKNKHDENEQKKIVLGILTGMLIENPFLREKGTYLVLDEICYHGTNTFHLVHNYAHLIKIPFFEGLKTSHFGEEKAILFQADFPGDPQLKHHPFQHCKNIRLIYSSSAHPLFAYSKSCDAVQLNLTDYRKIVGEIVGGDKMNRQSIVEEIRQMPPGKYNGNQFIVEIVL